MLDVPRSAGTVLVVDDVEANVELLKGLLAREGYQVRVARDGQAALEAVSDEAPDLVLLDVMMPKLNGVEVCRRLKADAHTRFIPVVLVTALHEREDKIRGITAGADDFLSKPVNAQELSARVRSLVRLKRHTDDLESAEAMICSLALTVEARDPYTNGHCQRLASYARAFGQALDLKEEDLAVLHRGGFLHDLGKVGVPDAVLLKAGPLTPEEVSTMRAHTVIGDTLLRDLRSLRPVRPIVRHHHERLDGSGYPDGLRADAIPLVAQIMGIVDVYDALTTTRPYRAALPPARAYDELSDEVRRGWRRRDLVDGFLALAQGGSLEEVVSSQ